MGMKRLTPESHIDGFIQSSLERLENAVIYNLKYVGEQCVNAARDSNSYKDQTGNLRSSVGYILVKNGTIINSDFKQVKEGKDGLKEGPKFAKSLVKEFPRGIALIVVAGMNYAACVAAKGYDVLDSAQLIAEKEVPRIMKQLGFK